MNIFSTLRNTYTQLNSFSLKIKLIGAVTGAMFLVFVLLTAVNYYSTKNEIVHKLKNNELPVYADNVRNQIILMIIQGIMPLTQMTGDSFFIHEINNPDIDVPQVLAYLKGIGDKHNVVIGFVSSLNASYYSNTGKWRKIDSEKEAWYFKFKNSNKEINFNVGRSADTQKVNLFQSVKVYSTDRDYLGVAYIGLNLKSVEQFILSRSLLGHSNQMLVSSDGRVIISADSSYISIDYDKGKNTNLTAMPGLGTLAPQILSGNEMAMEYTDSTGDVRIVMSRYIENLDSYIVMEISETELISSARRIFLRTMILGVIVFFFMLLLLLLIINRVVLRPIEYLIDVTSAYANGDLRIPVHALYGDEIGKLINSIEILRQKMNQTIAFIKESSTAILDAGTQIGSNSKMLAEMSANQATRIEGVFSSMEEMSAAIAETSKNSQDSEVLATQSREGIEYVQLLFNATMDSLNAINSKIQIIKDISDKTDMLAINASIEAARAGAEGKGFAVVASEIRKLAENTATAATDISRFTEESLKVAIDSVDKLAVVIPKLRQTFDFTQENMNAAMEQSNAANFITHSVAELNQISQDTARSSEMLSSKSEMLINQARKLREMIKYFKQ